MSKTIIVTGASRGIGHEIVKIAEKEATGYIQFRGM